MGYAIRLEEKAKVAAVGRDESDDAIVPKLLAYALLRDSERNGLETLCTLDEHRVEGLSGKGMGGLWKVLEVRMVVHLSAVLSLAYR